MALEIDGFSVLEAISKHKEYFHDIKNDCIKAAKTLATKHLKSAKMDGKSLLQFAGTIGLENFKNIADNLSDKEVSSVVGRIDRYNTKRATFSNQENRAHLLGLALGERSVATQAIGSSTRTGRRTPVAARPPITRSGASEALREPPKRIAKPRKKDAPT